MAPRVYISILLTPIPQQPLAPSEQATSMDVLCTSLVYQFTCASDNKNYNATYDSHMHVRKVCGLPIECLS